MTPILDDPRPFPAVLADWSARQGLHSGYAVAKRLGVEMNSARAWLAGKGAPRHERALRALMVLIEEGRA